MLQQSVLETLDFTGRLKIAVCALLYPIYILFITFFPIPLEGYWSLNAIQISFHFIISYGSLHSTSISCLGALTSACSPGNDHYPLISHYICLALGVLASDPFSGFAQVCQFRILFHFRRNIGIISPSFGPFAVFSCLPSSMTRTYKRQFTMNLYT